MSENPDVWRERCQEILTRRESMVDIEARSMMLRVALTYERMAEAKDNRQAFDNLMAKLAREYERLINLEQVYP